MALRGTIWGSICIVVTLSDIETIWTKFGQNPGFSLRNSVSLTPGPTVKNFMTKIYRRRISFFHTFSKPLIHLTAGPGLSDTEFLSENPGF